MRKPGLENAAWSSLVRDTMRKGYKFDKQTAMRQHRQMVDIYERRGIRTHFIEVDDGLHYSIFARDSSFMTPWGAVIASMILVDRAQSPSRPWSRCRT